MKDSSEETFGQNVILVGRFEERQPGDPQSLADDRNFLKSIRFGELHFAIRSNDTTPGPGLVSETIDRATQVETFNRGSASRRPEEEWASDFGPAATGK